MNFVLFSSCKSTLAAIFLCAYFTMVGAAKDKGKPPAFCRRGFQVAGLYHECWVLATTEHPYEPLYETQDVYDAAFVEKYASHMCSVVKPVALQCLRQQVTACRNAQKLVSIADESGGACTKNRLNPFFKMHIIDTLKPVSGDSRCFDVSQKSISCYMEAGDKVIKSGVNADDIGQFHKVADKFFDHLWQCMIDLFKSNTGNCPHWQIPMLLTLQRAAMPSLFGMRLNNYQISKLELEPSPQVTDGQSGEQKKNCKGQGCLKPGPDGQLFYILIKVLAQEPDRREEGSVVLQVDAVSSSKPKVRVSVADSSERGGEAVDVRDYLAELMSGENQLTLQEIRQIRKEQRRKNKEIRAYLTRIQESQRQHGGERWQSTSVTDQRSSKVKDLREFTRDTRYPVS